MDVTTVDPYTSTREEYTNALLQQQIPDDAPDKLVAYAVDLRELVRKLAFHPAMVESGNMAQTFMTPALSKNKVYFMWDFVGRTLSTLYRIPPGAPLNGGNEQWTDVIGRSVMAGKLLLDTDPGMLDMMVESTYPGQPGDRPVIGEDIKALARKLTGNRSE